MPFAGISYKVLPGHADSIATIFSPENFQRVDSPVMRDEAGEELGYLICTGLFLATDTIVRVIQHDGGTAQDVGRHMSVQDGVHAAERELMPFLREPRDTETAAGFLAHFDRSMMDVLDLRQIDNRPAAGLLALRYRIRPVPAAQVASLLPRESLRLRPPHADEPGAGRIIATFLLVKDDSVVRVVQCAGRDPEEAIGFLLAQPPPVAMDAWLAPLLAEPDTVLLEPADCLERAQMRVVSHLSASVVE